MNTNEISGKRQLEFLADFDYIREAGTAGEEKAAESSADRKLWTVLAWRVIWKNFLLIPFR